MTNQTTNNRSVEIIIIIIISFFSSAFRDGSKRSRFSKPSNHVMGLKNEDEGW
jgi:hypothetical protein